MFSKSQRFPDNRKSKASNSNIIYFDELYVYYQLVYLDQVMCRLHRIVFTIFLLLEVTPGPGDYDTKTSQRVPLAQFSKEQRFSDSSGLVLRYLVIFLLNCRTINLSY